MKLKFNLNKIAVMFSSRPSVGLDNVKRISPQKKLNPHSLFNICSKVVRRNPRLEKELFKCGPVMNFEYSYERRIKDILQTVSRPYFIDNKSFERFFRKLVRDNIRVSKNVQFMLRRVRYLKEKIDSFNKVYGVVLEIYFDLSHLEETLEMLI